MDGNGGQRGLHRLPHDGGVAALLYAQCIRSASGACSMQLPTLSLACSVWPLAADDALAGQAERSCVLVQ